MIDALRSRLLEGLVIPAHPLALNAARRFDERCQRALTRYYHAAGAGGIAVGVHTTQFAIREPRHGLLKPVLALAAETAKALDHATGRRTVLVAGICGAPDQAVREAAEARILGYHAGLLSLGAMRGSSEDDLIRHAARVAEEIPLFGFYLQPAAGGIPLGYRFWRRLAGIQRLVAIKIAPFNRYATLDVVRAVAESGRAGEIALYTGNDDQILLDLASTWTPHVDGASVRVQMAGGLLGHWAVWTLRAVELLARAREARARGAIPEALLVRAHEVTDMNAALFDVANGFRGAIAGVQEVLRRGGLLETNLCLDPAESLSPGQSDELDRVRKAYPHLTDDDFVAEHRDAWLR